MDSHVLNSYHRARYGIPDARIGSNSESCSSESSCNIQNSPDYPQFAAQVPAGCVVERSQTQSSIKVDSYESSSESENESQNDIDDQAYDIEYEEEVVVDDDDDYEVVDDDEQDMGITEVYAVDPDLDLENSDESDNEGGYLQEEDKNYHVEGNSKDTEQNYEQDTLEIKLDGPVVANVDEYFIKNTKSLKKIEVKDEVVDSDLDQLFVNNAKPVINKSYVDDDAVKLVDKSEVNVVPKVQESFNKKNSKISSNTIDSDALPHIEKIKRFLLEDIPYAKHVKSTQRSCSLPHSPVHFSYFDADDAKTSLSFEDLNIDLTDFTFDDSKNDKNDQTTSLCIKDNTSNFDIPKVLTEEEVNGFLISSYKIKNDNIKECDMEIEKPVKTQSSIPIKKHINERRASAPLVSKVLNFQIEKSEVKDDIDLKIEPEDYIDVESVNDVVPVLQANNVSSLLEQFEETEKLNRNVISSPKEVEVKVGNASHGLRLQDAAMQLNRNKMRHILMPASAKMAAMKKPSKPVLFDHDYCVPKKRPINPKLKGGQSLLKPEVVSTNHKILSSRHRSCRNKTIDYHISSDEENGDKKDKNVLKLNVKAHTNHRKKNVRETDSEQNVNKINSSVITNEASKASDNISQSYPGIKLKIRNKSKVILINCDVKKDSQDLVKSVDVEDFVKATRIEAIKTEKDIDYTVVATKEIVNNSVITKVEDKFDSPVKEEPRPIKEFYTALFDNKKEVEIKLPESHEIKAQTSPNSEDAAKTVVDVKPQKKKLNLQEYKLRHGVNSNASSRTVSPEAIFPEMNFTTIGKTTQKDLVLPEINTISNVDIKAVDPSLMFDPIRDASRKVLMKDPKKIKAEALRKREDDILMRKIPKVENFQLQPLISDAEMLKITGMLTDVKPKDASNEQHKPNKDYEEKILVSIGINTNNKYLKPIVNQIIVDSKPIAPNADKAVINFKIKKHETIIKSNVFDSKKQESCPTNKPAAEKRQSSPVKAESKIDKERFKDITETIKSVEKQVVKKISSNSLFASIQDVVKKKAPDEGLFRKANVKTKRVKDYDSETQHGEDKVILHLEKNRVKSKTVNIGIQTDYTSEYVPLTDVVFETDSVVTKKKSTTSESSMASATSTKTDKTTSNDRSSVQKSGDRNNDKRSRSRVNRSRSRNRNERYRRRSRSRSYRTPKKRSSSRNRSNNYRNRQSVSPYRRNRLPYRRPDSRRKNYRFKSKSKSRSRSPCAKKVKLSPEMKKVKERTVTPPPPPPVRKPTVSESSDSSTGTYTSTSSSSSSSSSSDSSQSGSEKSSSTRQSRARRSMTPPSVARSRKSSTPKSRRRSLSPSLRSNRSRSRRSNSPRDRRSVSGGRRSLTPNGYRNMPAYRLFNSETRDNKAPVEERRIVYVGRLDKEATKNSLRREFTRFGRINEVKLHTNVDGTRYGFVTFRSGGEAWALFGAARDFPQYDLGFGGRRAFCKRQYADLDGIDDEYIEQGYMPPPLKQPENVSFEQMLLDVQNKLKQRKSELKPNAIDPHRNECKSSNGNLNLEDASP